MKAMEIRLGNLLQTKGGTPYELTMYDFVAIYDGKKEAFGIQLNHNWLNKFGARQLPHGYFIGKLKFTYEINELSEFVRFHYSGKITYMRYVHQLQNLYFAITGEELNIVDTSKGSGFILERDLKLK